MRARAAGSRGPPRDSAGGGAKAPGRPPPERRPDINHQTLGRRSRPRRAAGRAGGPGARLRAFVVKPRWQERPRRPPRRHRGGRRRLAAAAARGSPRRPRGRPPARASLGAETELEFQDPSARAWKGSRPFAQDEGRGRRALRGESSSPRAREASRRRGRRRRAPVLGDPHGRGLGR